jgi:hypothetical protein
MRSDRAIATLSLALSFTASAGAFAQTASSAKYGVWWTAGWHAPIADHSDLVNNRILMMVGIERRFAFKTGRLGTLSYAPALLPAVNATNNLRFRTVNCGRFSDDELIARTIVQIKGICYQGTAYSAFGVGVLPVALRWHTDAERRLGLTADLDGGGVWFSHRVPVRDGTYFNFAARGGIDGVVRVSRTMWVSAGYRHLHLSNGGTGTVNPGLDAPLIALGIAWR